MKILRNMALVLLLLTLLVGCRPCGRLTADYRESPFRAEIRFERGGVTVYAEAETTRTDGVLTLSSLRLLAPPSLAGIELVREGESLILLRDGLRTSSVGAGEWWETASLLCAAGKLCYVCDTEWEGLSLEYAEITEGDCVYEVLREAETGIPKRISSGERSLTVIRFEGVQART